MPEVCVSGGFCGMDFFKVMNLSLRGGLNFNGIEMM